MATVSFSFLLPLVLLSGLGGGVPLGLPPLPEDPTLARVAPEPCLAYLSWSGAATPDPESANQVEQLLAETEVQQFLAAIDKQIQAATQRLQQPGSAGGSPATTPRGPAAGAAALGGPPGMAGPRPNAKAGLLAELLPWARTLLLRPAAFYLSDLKINRGGPPEVHAGAIVSLGDQAAAFKATAEKYQAMLPPGVSESVEIEGGKWSRLRLGPGAPAVTWGTKGKYLIVAVGEGELEAILKRARGDVPPWLAAVRKQLPLQRVSTVSYLNVKAILDAVTPAAGPQAGAIARAVGLGNVTSVAGVGGLDETRYVRKTLVAVDGEPEGVLRLFNEKPLTADDLAPIPADATIAVAARINADRLLETLLSAVEKIEPRGRAAIMEGMGHADSEVSIDLREELIKSLGDSWCLYNSPGEGGLVLTGLTAVVPVRDAAHLAKVQERLVSLNAAQKGGPLDKRIQHFQFAGQEIYFLDAADSHFPFAPAWCLTQKELIVATFPQNVKAYLSRGGEFRSLAQVPEVARLFEAGGGPLMLCYSDTPKLFELLYPFAPMLGQAVFSELRHVGIDMNVAMLPSAAAIGKHLRPAVSSVRRTAAGIEVLSQQSLPGGGGVPLLPAAAAFMGVRVFHVPVAMQGSSHESH